MAVNLSNLGDPLSFRSLTEKTINLEKLILYVRKVITPDLHKSMMVTVDENPMDMNVAVTLSALFMKKLAKAEPVVEESEYVTESCGDDFILVPSRPIDHLLKFLASVCPIKSMSEWISGKQELDRIRIKYPDFVTKKTQVNHYHVIPWELDKSKETRVRFVFWDGEHYDGGPEEWGDLKAIRDFVMNSETVGDPCRAEMLWYEARRMAYQSKVKAGRHV